MPTGYAHSQDRYFQMDLLRRVAAGEVAALVGADAIPLDQRNRTYRFRAPRTGGLCRAGRPASALLQRYADGVNTAQGGAAGTGPSNMACTGVGRSPGVRKTRLLVVDAMYLDLQSAEIEPCAVARFLRDAVPADMLAFLTPRGQRAGRAAGYGVAAAATPPRLPRARPDWLDGRGAARSGGGLGGWRGGRQQCLRRGRVARRGRRCPGGQR